MITEWSRDGPEVVAGMIGRSRANFRTCRWSTLACEVEGRVGARDILRWESQEQDRWPGNWLSNGWLVLHEERWLSML